MQTGGKSTEGAAVGVMVDAGIEARMEFQVQTLLFSTLSPQTEYLSSTLISQVSCMGQVSRSQYQEGFHMHIYVSVHAWAGSGTR